ncbi:MAG: DUF454 domain-containing protein [Gammaproteobacteria bacterium]|nr:MAG: DUF454 domain-containing protein [Gammaproteobacteria bacterium]
MNNSVVTIKDASSTRRFSRKRLVYQFVGHLLFGIGFIGILLPVLPTTIFWIGAAACYLKSSPANYHALVANKRYGKTIVRYLEHGVIDKSGKKIAVIGMLASSIALLFIPIDNTAKLLSMMGMAIAAVYVLTRPGQISN